MAPAPNMPHQGAVLRIAHYLLMHVEFPGLGKVMIAPFDVELSPKNVFQPDVLVVLNAHLDRLQEKRFIGAPDLVVEVASQSTAAYDRLTKFDEYAKAGIPEYWLANAKAHTIQVLALEQGDYHSLGIFRGEQTLLSRIVPDLPIAVEKFFM